MLSVSHNERHQRDASGTTEFPFSVTSMLRIESFTPFNDAHCDVKLWPLGFFALFPIKKDIFLWGGKGDSKPSPVHCPLVRSMAPGALPWQAWLVRYMTKVCGGQRLWSGARPRSMP